jgi:TolA-binding protein
MIRFYLVFIFVCLLFTNKIIAIETTLIPQAEVAKTQNVPADDFSLQDEISKLNLEVEDLKDQVMQQEQESKGLKEELESYRKKEEENNTRSLRIERLKRILSQPVFSVQEVEDKDLDFAYSAILLNNLKEAKEGFIRFLAKNVKDNPNYYKIVKVPISTPKKLIKDPLNINAEKDNLEVIEENNNTRQEVKEEKIVDEDFVNNYQKSLDKANYLLGEIYLVDIQPKEAVPYLVEAYNKSKDPDIIILSLIGITESFVILKKSPEACVSIQRIERTLEKIKQSDPDYEITPSDISFIELIKETSSCNVSE